MPSCDLVADGNSVLLVDHDTEVLSEADWIIEMGPEAGNGGGYVIAEGSIPEIMKNKASMIGPFLSGQAKTQVRERAEEQELFSLGTIHLSTDRIHTVKPLEVDIPKGRLTVVTGVSGSGKTTMVLEMPDSRIGSHDQWDEAAGTCKTGFGGRVFSM